MKKLLLLGTITVCSFSAFAQEPYYYPTQTQQPVYIYQPGAVQPNQTYYVQEPVIPTVKHKRIQSDFAKKNDTKVYISGKIKHVSMDAGAKLGDSFDIDDNVFGGAIAIGASNKTPAGTIRAEVEYNKNSATEKKHDILYINNDYYAAGKAKFEIESQALMLNTYYNFETGTRISPYIGAGVGLSQIKGTLKMPDYDISDSIKKTNFAWQAGLGISLNLTDNFAIDTGYRYFDYGNFKKNDFELSTTAHEFYTGARVSF